MAFFYLLRNHSLRINTELMHDPQFLQRRANHTNQVIGDLRKLLQKCNSYILMHNMIVGDPAIICEKNLAKLSVKKWSSNFFEACPKPGCSDAYFSYYTYSFTDQKDSVYCDGWTVHRILFHANEDISATLDEGTLEKLEAIIQQLLA